MIYFFEIIDCELFLLQPLIVNFETEDYATFWSVSSKRPSFAMIMNLSVSPDGKY